MGKRGGGLATTLVLALVVAALGIALGVAVSAPGFVGRLPVVGGLLGEDRPARTTTSPVVIEGIQDLDRLATARWRESVVVTRESGGTPLERFLAGEKVLLVATGGVEAGVDLANLDAGDVRVGGETVSIRLPEPEILNASLDEEKTRVYDRDFGILKLRPDDALAEDARAAALEEIEAAALEEGILERAERNAEDSIRTFVTALGFERVRFE